MTLLLVVAAISLSACSRDDPDPDAPQLEEPFALGETGEGTCLQFDEAVGAEVEDLPVVECAVGHSHEIYRVAEYVAENGPTDVYPGFDVLDEFAQIECLKAFEPFVGTNPFDSSLFYSWLVPTLDSWNDENDREVLCVLGSLDGAPLMGSMKDADV